MFYCFTYAAHIQYSCWISDLSAGEVQVEKKNHFGVNMFSVTLQKAEPNIPKSIKQLKIKQKKSQLN